MITSSETAYSAVDVTLVAVCAGDGMSGKMSIIAGRNRSSTAASAGAFVAED